MGRFLALVFGVTAPLLGVAAPPVVAAAAVGGGSAPVVYDPASYDYDSAAALAEGRAGADSLTDSAQPPIGDSVDGYDPVRSFVAPRTTSWLDDAATSKVPSGWGTGRPNKKGVGTRWVDPANPKTNGIRIDQGNPASPLTTQQVDHVVVRSGGRVVGRDGNPISGLIRENYEMAHIPLDEWLTWSTWNAP